MTKISYIGKCLLLEIAGEKVLAVGDLHLGYEQYLNEAGVFVSREMFKEMIEYFDNVFKKAGKVDRVVLLGDVKHGFGAIVRQEWNDVLKLIDYLHEKCDEIIITRGNHDKIIGLIVEKREVEVKDYFVFDEVCFLHGDCDYKEIHDSKIKIWVVGHAHPAIKLSDGVKVEKFKCFLVGKYEGRQIIIVPSFIEANEGSDPRENELGMAWEFDLEKFQVKIVSGEKEDLEVKDFGWLSEIN